MPPARSISRYRMYRCAPALSFRSTALCDFVFGWGIWTMLSLCCALMVAASSGFCGFRYGRVSLFIVEYRAKSYNGGIHTYSCPLLQPSAATPKSAASLRLFYGCSTVVLIGFTCPATTVGTVILRALDRVRERALGCFARSPKSPPAMQASSGVPNLPPVFPSP